MYRAKLLRSLAPESTARPDRTGGLAAAVIQGRELRKPSARRHG
jgi:hypothetical protein